MCYLYNGLPQGVKERPTERIKKVARALLTIVRFFRMKILFRNYDVAPFNFSFLNVLRVRFTRKFAHVCKVLDDFLARADDAC